MVVPTVRIVVEHDDCRVLPVSGCHDRIHDLHHELLLEERIGISRMPVHEARRLEKGHGRELNVRPETRDLVAATGRPRYAIDREEHGEIVLVLRLIGVANHGRGTRRKMSKILRRGKVLKRLVMADVVLFH